MSVTLNRLFSANDNPFRLSLCAGQNGIHNVVNWIYMLEDEYIAHYFRGSELIVTTGMKQKHDPHWLLSLVDYLYEKRAAGLIINTGKFVFTIPPEVKDFCDIHDFPLLTMPWEVHITEMTQDFCVTIINNRQESYIHDQAIRDAILNHDNVEDYREILGSYYNLDNNFTVFTIYAKYIQDQQVEESAPLPSNLDYWLETKLRRLKKHMNAMTTRIGVVQNENIQLLIINDATEAMLSQIRDVIQDAYGEAIKTHQIFIGIGDTVSNLSSISSSFQRAIIAMRMAIYQNESVIRFEEMGFYKVLFSVKDETILYSYADEILKPIDEYDAKNHNYMELLKCYIHNDRSLEETAKALFIHRNTVNYQIQKLKTILNSPLKTLDDLFPYQVALAIREMARHTIQIKKI